MDQKRQSRLNSEILGFSLFLAMLLLLASSLLLPLLETGGTALSLSARLLFKLAVFLLPVGFVRVSFAKIHMPSAPPARRSSAGGRLLIAVSSVGLVVILQILYGSVFPSSMTAMGVSRETPLGELVLMLFVYVVAPAVLEELYFRDTVMRALTIHRKLLALLISSLVFALLHVSFEQFPIAFLCGLVLGVAYLATGSFGYAVLVHFTCNLIWYAAEIVRAWSVQAYSIYMQVVFAVCVILLAAGIPTLKSTFGTIFEDREDAAPASYFWSLPMILFFAVAVLIPIVWQSK